MRERNPVVRLTEVWRSDVQARREVGGAFPSTQHLVLGGSLSERDHELLRIR